MLNKTIFIKTPLAAACLLAFSVNIALSAPHFIDETTPLESINVRDGVSNNRVTIKGHPAGATVIYGSIYDVSQDLLHPTTKDLRNNAIILQKGNLESLVAAEFKGSKTAPTAPGNVSNNSITIINEGFTPDSSANNIIAGLSVAHNNTQQNSHVDGNRVTINNSTSIAGKEYLIVDDGLTSPFIIKGIYGGINVSASGASANRNSVIVTNQSNIKNNIHGGVLNTARSTENAPNLNVDEVNNNRIVVTARSTIEGDIIGGKYIGGANTLNGAYASNNRITLSGDVKHTGDIYGSHASLQGNGKRYYSQGNVIVVANSNVNGDIYGAYLENGSAQDIKLTNNHIKIVGDSHFNPSGSIFGGLIASGTPSTGAYDAFTGNTFVYSGNKPLVANELGGFERYTFNIRADDYSAPLVQVNTLYLEGTIRDELGREYTKQSSVDIQGINAGRRLNYGEKFILVKAGNIIGEGTNWGNIGGIGGIVEEEIDDGTMEDPINNSRTTLFTTSALQGISFLYDLKVIKDSETGEISAEVIDLDNPEEPEVPVDPEEPEVPVDPEEPEVPVDPEEPEVPVDPEEPEVPVDPEEPEVPVDPEEPEVPVDPEEPEVPVDPEEPEVPVDPEEPGQPAGRLNSQLKSLSEGYLAGAILPTRGADLLISNVINNIDSTTVGYQAIAQLGGGFTRYSSGSHVKSTDYLMVLGGSYTNYDGLTLGGFIEGGKSDYKTYNEFSDRDTVRAKGDSYYYGLGAFMKLKMDENFYTEASLRYGNTKNKYHSDDFLTSDGLPVGYNAKSRYFGGHVGLGYEWTVADTMVFDLSARYFHTNVSAEDVEIAGDPIHFDSFKSNRARLTFGLTNHYSENFSYYGSMSYEYEFDGSVNATTHSIYDIEAPTIQGSTGIIGLGMEYIPNNARNLKLNVNAEGYAGKRRGGNVGVSFKYYYQQDPKGQSRY
ncbi:autotransporter outer membrane beta-barrel domain-containing protein [Ignatzschineria sp. LJL83]